jgi:hypothetical protein
MNSELEHDWLAARAVLLILRAACDQPAQLDSLVLRSGRSVMSIDEAVHVLLTARKPLESTARVRSGILNVGFRPLTRKFRPLYEFQLFVANEKKQQTAELPWLPWSRVCDPTACTILLRGSDEELLISLAAGMALSRNYLITLPYTVTGDYPNMEQQQQGIEWVVRISGGIPIKLFGFF